jgi:competence protein ComEC
MMYIESAELDDALIASRRYMLNQKVTAAVVFLIVAIIGFWMGVLFRLKRLGDALASNPPLLIAQFVDVGAGDAALVHSPDGMSILIDSGSDQAGAREIVAQALRLPDRLPEAVILTSPTPSSIGGLKYVIDQLPLRCPIVLPCSAAKFLRDGGQSAADDIAAADRRHLQVLTWQQFEGSPLLTGESNSETSITVIPVSNSDGVVERGGDADGGSLAVRIDYGASSLFYAAGLNPHEEDQLIAQRVNLPCDVLAATDSGAAGALSGEFLALAGPAITVVSTSSDNPPDQQVLARLAAAHSSVYRTDLSGTITIGFGDQVSFSPVFFPAGAPLPAISDRRNARHGRRRP